uniref:brefeldin A-inhibited guanine nucleotide-exchange protein 1 isoform X1 n=1 Tax=Ciona intestinalis TaxID=7719 RepID=UPI000180BB83|nr:brefeldin A-inhibited guanine nucleotide-exchange protein 1 isoform X1 [Ciona intestinalis]|eukprot:XP_009862113.1 brefeldin A-inhibited guanine nucleotide-exchange protein 1 isoform X1 [Ciona intestinalis]
MQQSKQTRSMFLTRALERILADKELKRSQNSQLKKACRLALDEIKQDLEHDSPGDGPPKSPFTIIEADRYFLVFEMACKSKSPSIVTAALDCLQKMIVYGILVGNAPDSSVPGKRLIDRVIDAICQCFNGIQTDEHVQLQIIKVLLTAVTSNNCEIHEGTLLQAVRTCYNIYLASRNMVNQTTARATLTQMLNVIFSRMEAQAEYDKSLAKKLQEEKETEQELNQSIQVPINEQNGEIVQDDAPESDQHHTSMIADHTNGIMTSQKGEENGATESEDGAFQVVNGVAESSDDSASLVVEEIVSNIVDFVVAQNEEEEEAEFDQLASMSSRLSVTSSDATSSYNDDLLKRSVNFSHVLQKDAFLVFRSFCKLSMKLLSDGPPDPKSHELRSKILSLHLLHSILQSAGPVFKDNDMFINAIKQYLCVALSKNGVSSVPDVFHLSLEIFVKLLENFKTHLKVQIQVFFKEIFLNILESSSSSFQHKWMVLETLLKICSDAQCMVDIYVNYDCDINAANVFHQLVTLLCKIAQVSHNHVGITPAQEHMMRKKSLECLVMITKSMVDWSSELYINPHSMSHLGKEHLPESGNPGNLSITSSVSNMDSTHSLNSDTSDHLLNSAPGGAADNPETLEVMKQQKDILEQGILMFNRKPSKGIAFLQAQGMIGNTANDVAEFLHSETRLNPSEIGDYIGEHDKWNKEVMYSYIDNLDFSSLDFVTAIRRFLEGFRLPGEAQKIDRLMEKFASRYCDCNPHGTIFASADAAYVLGYSVIMLTTDLHSSQVKRKMTKEDYIRMNRGINDSKDLPSEYLENIYDQIKKKEISIKPTRSDNKVSTLKGIAPAAQRLREMQDMASTAKALMEAASHVEAEFICTTHYEHVRPMFKLCWRSLMVAFSMGLQDFEDKQVTSLCLDGMRYAVRVACIFGLSLERDTFIQALSRFSLLQANAGIRELKLKNIEAIKTLISIAYTDGNYLQESWHEILKCISHLELLQLIGSGVRDQATTAMKRSAGIMDNNPILTKTFGMEQRKLATIQESMGETSSQSFVVAVDRIFTGSTRLDGDAIVDFVQWLSKVSLSELCNPSHPRMFSLQKIVEISYYNMGRIRIQWSRIWAILGEHFNAVGCSDDEGVAFFAVDSLRQLSTKFLEKGELPGFSFQKDFLRPFEHIMKHNPTLMIQDMVVRCIAQMVSSQASNIKSGWKNIFTVFTIAASHQDESIVELAFETTANIINETFQFYFSSIIHCFQDAVSALREFSCSAFPDTSMEAIRLIRQCADYVALKPELFEDLIGDEAPASRTGERVWVRGWFPILFELSCIISRCKLDVRTRGLTVMFEIMKTHGHTFTENWWNDLFQIIFRIFDQMKIPEQQIEKSDWFATTCNHALFAICDVFTQYYDILAPTLLPDVYNQLLWCVEKENEQLARSGVNCFENLILSNGEKFTDEVWQLSCSTMQKVFKMVSPNNILEWKQKDGRDELFKLQLSCVLTSELIECVDRILFFPNTTKHDDEANIRIAQDHTCDITTEVRNPDEMFSRLNEEQLLVMVRCLHESHVLAKRFNSDNEQRTNLWKAGFKGKSKPNLIKQETTSLACALRILFRLALAENCDEKITTVLVRTCQIALKYFALITSESHRDSWTPILLIILTRMLRMGRDKFTLLSSDLHTPLCDLLLHEIKPEVRFLLRRYFVRCNEQSK